MSYFEVNGHLLSSPYVNYTSTEGKGIWIGTDRTYNISRTFLPRVLRVEETELQGIKKHSHLSLTSRLMGVKCDLWDMLGHVCRGSLLRLVSSRGRERHCDWDMEEGGAALPSALFPSSTRSFTMLKNPFAEARCRGLSPTSPLTLTSAPNFRRTLVTWRNPSFEFSMGSKKQECVWCHLSTTSAIEGRGCGVWRIRNLRSSSAAEWENG